MVLQQAPQQAVIWGFTNKTGVKVSASLDGAAAITATSGTDHTWRITLPATPASTTPHKIAISSSAGDAATLENVLFGEVFIWWVGPLGPLGPLSSAALALAVSSRVDPDPPAPAPPPPAQPQRSPRHPRQPHRP